jgi:Sec-independent protein secretion pathway components
MTLDLTSFAFLTDIGGGEMMLILFVVLLLFGGDQMPQMAKKLGKTISQFKKAANEVEREIKRAIDEVPDVPDVRATIEEAVQDKPRAKTKSAVPPPALPGAATPATSSAPAPAATTSTDGPPITPASPTPAPANPPHSPPPPGT